MAMAFEGGILLLALLVAWSLGVSLVEQVGFGGRDVWASLAGTCPLLLVLIWATRSRWRVLRRLLREIEEQVLPMFTGSSIFELAAISLVAGVAEETLFRGVLQTALGASLHPVVALVLVSTLFGLAHFITPSYAVLASLIGFYLGCLLMFFGNLLVPILVHAIYDFAALVYLLGPGRELRPQG